VCTFNKQTLHTRIKCAKSVSSDQKVCIDFARSSEVLTQFAVCLYKVCFCLLWVAPGQVAIHVGAKGLPLLPGERARLTIIPVQAQVRLGRVAAKLLILPTTLSHGWQCIQFAYNLHTTCRLCAYIVFSICRLSADFVHTLCFQYADLMQTLFLFTWNLFPHTN
jgi:hypothetical protein